MLKTNSNGSTQAGASLEMMSPKLQESIENLIRKEKYIKYDVKIKIFDTRGNNFLGQLYEIDITGETVVGKKETNVFVKERPEMEHFKVLPVPELYSNETFIYKELSKLFVSLQDEANVPIEDRYRIAKAYEETDTDALIFENLAKKGFKIYGKLEPIPIKYAELCIQELAKLHALSFVIENKMPDYFNKNIKIRKNPFNFDEDCRGMTRNICAHVARLCDDEVRTRFEKFETIFLEKFSRYGKDQTSVRCTLMHGDYKKNNIMVRLENGEPVEICAVDYQFTAYACPILDFLCFIFTSTDREFRKKHLNYLKNLYFISLSRFLEYFDMDVEAVYPRREFEKVYTEWLDYGLCVGLFVSIVAFAPDDGLDLANKTLTDLPYCPGEQYDHLFRGLIDDFVEWGLL